MSLERNGNGPTVVRCDVPKCQTKYVTFSHKSVAREQAAIRGWRRALRRVVGLYGAGQADICPLHPRRLTLVALVALVVAGGCSGACLTTPPDPQPYLDVQRDWPARGDEVDIDRWPVVAGARRWEAFGFRVLERERPGFRGDAELALPECGTRWWERETRECVISVRLHAAPVLDVATDAGYALPEMRTVWVDSDYRGIELERIVAHEVGHVLLVARDHLAPGARGLMAPEFGGEGPTLADRDLFCRLREVCP